VSRPVRVSPTTPKPPSVCLPQPHRPFDHLVVAKERIYAGFARALRHGGVLFVGGTEAILKPQALSLQVLGPGLYARVGWA
jgi:hypothetical protein